MNCMYLVKSCRYRKLFDEYPEYQNNETICTNCLLSELINKTDGTKVTLEYK